ncbi:MAG: response regulator, partial [Planctomycetota bacterium]
MESLLVIDDEPGICKTIQSILKSDSLQIMIASNAEQGLQLVREESPNVILLD